jgi:hypothetical protein
MLNNLSIEAVRASRFTERFRHPLYDSYCFSRIPATTASLLGASTGGTLPPSTLYGMECTYDKVVLFFIDAFGWTYFERYQDRYPFLQRIINDGVVSMLTSQFPSTTAAHVTTMHTGQRVDESGVFEWYYYEPKLDAVIAPLLFSYAGTKSRNQLSGVIDPRELFPTDTFYKQLRANGIKSYIFQSRLFTPSPYSDVVYDGAFAVVPHMTLSEALTNLRHSLVTERNKAYFFLYHADIDTVAHQYGPDSAQFEAEIDAFFIQAERFIQSCQGACGKTIFLMTADHGQMQVDPRTTIYLNRDIPESSSWIRCNARDEMLVPAGSPRDLFLYIKPEYKDEAETKLRTALANKADVYRCEQLMQNGMFGDAPGTMLRSRMADLVILPYAGESVWWHEENKFVMKSIGHHGGLSPEEMEIPFLALPL